MLASLAVTFVSIALIIDPTMGDSRASGSSHRTPPDDTPGWEAFSKDILMAADPDIAAGPNDLIAIVNTEFTVYDFDGSVLDNQSISGSGGFFGSAGAGGHVGDPSVRYDTLSGRFIMTATDFGGDNVYVAISPSGTALGTWSKRQIPMSQFSPGQQSLAFPDYPRVGADGDAIYIPVSIINGSPATAVVVVDKADLIGGITDPYEATRAAGGSGTMQSSSASTPAQYHVRIATSTSMGIQATNFASSTVNSTTVTIPFCGSPPSTLPQSGASNFDINSATFTPRMTVYNHNTDSLWVAHTIEHPSDSAASIVRWYEVRINGWPISGSPSLAQYGNVVVAGSPRVSTFYPALYADDAGNMGLVCGRTSSDEYPGFMRVFRRASDSSGTTRAQAFLKEGEGSAPTNFHWGDYFGASLDRYCPGRMWGHGQYGVTSLTLKWKTWVGSFFIDCVADYNLDGYVNQDDFDAFEDDYLEQEPAADIDGDTFVDFTDYLLFNNIYENPCEEE